jgi:tetratricopeptide (TPR) repeat protein
MRLTGVLFAACVLSTAAAASDQADFYRLLSHCADLTRTPDERIEACRHLLNSTGLEPEEYAGAELNSAVAYQEKGDNDGALAAFARALSHAPDMWQVYNDRVELRIKTGDLDAAVDDYSHLVKMDPAKFRMKMYGWEYGSRTKSSDGHGEPYETSVYDGAIADLKPRLSDAFYRRGLGKRGSGDAAGGDADIKTALSIDPGAAGRSPAGAKP